METTQAPNQLKIITYVLDDDYEELMLLEPHLKRVCGAELEMFTDPAKFIDAIEEGAHIAIIDHNLSARIDGIDVGRRVLEKNPLAFLILYSGSAVPRVWQTATNAGFRRLVDKNDANCYEQIAAIVEQAIPTIRENIERMEWLCQLNLKYEKYL